MADIHIGAITKTGEGKGLVQLIYHFNLDTPKAGIVPTPDSSIDSELDQSERDALAAGTRVEFIQKMSIENAQSQPVIVAAIKNSWLEVKPNYNSEFNFKYKFYGVTINDATA